MSATEIPRSIPRLTPVPTVPSLGDLRPQSDQGVQMPRDRPAELDDPDWLRKQAAVHGDRAIAKQLGTTRDIVRGARRRWGIQTQPGRRRGFVVQAVTTVTTAAHERVIARYQTERSLRDGPAPSVFLLETRNKALRDALLSGEPDLICEALEAAAAGMLLMLDHEHARRALS